MDDDEDTDTDKRPGDATPQDGQAPDAENRDNNQPDKGSNTDSQVKDLRAEAAKYRTQRNDLQAQFDELKAKLDEAETQKLIQKDEWKTLAEQRAESLQTAQQAAETYKAQVAETLIEAHLRSQLAASGITNADQQDILLPGIRRKAEVKVGEGMQIEGDVSSVIAGVVAALGLGQAPAPEPAKPKQRLNPAVGLLQQNLPSGGDETESGDVGTQFFNALVKSVSGTAGA